MEDCKSNTKPKRMIKFHITNLSGAKFLVTGGAGFIGSNLLEALLKLNQRVVGLDNFSTGYQHNLDEVQSLVSSKQWSNFNYRASVTSIRCYNKWR